MWTMRLAIALVGLAVLGVSQADACGRCRGCGCCQGPQPVCCPGPVAYLPAQVAAPAPVAAADKDKKDAEADIKANLAKLSAEDRKLAEAQKWCVIEDDNRLGEMGVPIKLLVKDQPVFICCKGCKDQALKDADKTLAKVKELKAKAAKEK
jgi:hypothetical protein